MLDNFKVETLSSCFYNEKKMFSFEVGLFDLNNILVSKIFIELKKSEYFLTSNDFKIKNIEVSVGDLITTSDIYNITRLYFINCIKNINLILSEKISFIKQIKKNIFHKKNFDFDINLIKKNIFIELEEYNKCISFYCFNFFSNYKEFLFMNKLKEEHHHFSTVYRNLSIIMLNNEHISNLHWVPQRKAIRIKYSDNYIPNFEDFIYVHSDIYIMDSVKEEKALEIKQSYDIKIYYDKNILFLFKNEIKSLEDNLYQKLKNISYELLNINKKIFLMNFTDSEDINTKAKYICIFKTPTNRIFFDNKEFLSGDFGHINNIICTNIKLTKENEEKQDAITFKYSA